MASLSSSYSSSYKYDVFLSFRGEDTRDNFTSHLYAALGRKKLKTFIDEELKRGDQISPALLSAIEGSKISIIIFSKNYAASKWCLDELVKILECKNMNCQTVVPVFYHVDPSEVRKQIGSFREAFVLHENQFKEMPEKVQNWRAALTEASNLSGWATKEIRSEAKLVDVIVKGITKSLENTRVLTDFDGLVGLSSRIEQIKSLLCIGLPGFQIVGIWGTGGIGKTTIAGAIFNQISREFEGKCFLENVREESEKGSGLVHLRERILFEILEETFKIRTPNLPEYIRERLQRMKVFIVLDDVNKVGQLDYLIGGLDQFGPGSRIIVTTRDKRVLESFRVGYIYEVNGLEYHESLELFCNYAFKENHCSEDLLVLSKRVLDYANGNPLALRVLGSSLHRKSKVEWENALKNLKRISDPDIYDVLKISYNELKAEEKSMFLDVACFFNGEHKNYLIKVQDDPDFGDYGLNVLISKSLVTISFDNILQMHDLLQEMGQEIVRHESVKEPGKRSRLWYHEDIYHVLKKNKGTDAVEGIFLDLSKIKDIHLSSRAFRNMSNLRLLKFYMPEHGGIPIMSSKVHLDQGLEYLPEELRYLHWYEYPLKILPPDFEPENLLELNLPYSKVEIIWEVKKEAPKLKYIDLHHSQYLTRISDPSKTPNLERINLLNCTKLAYIPSSIHNFINLVVLCLKGCESLRYFPSNIHFRSPIEIDFSGCVNLAKFPNISGNVIELYLRKTAIEEVPSSIENLTNLVKLDLSYCTRLKSLSTSICKLRFLCKLDLGYCSNFESFPEIMEKMERLRIIDLHSTLVEELPSSMENLEGLKELRLIGCYKLCSLPASLRNLKSLEFLNVERLFSIADLNKLEDLSDFGHSGLTLPPLLSGLSSLTKLVLTCCDIIEIPQDIGCLSSLELLFLCGNNFQSLPASIKQLSRLRKLYLSACNMLQSLPELPARLRYLTARNCKQLRSLPELPSSLQELDASISKPSEYGEDKIEFLFTNCLKLNEEANSGLADSQLRIQHMAITSLRLFYEKEYDEPPGISICLPGSQIPDWFRNQCSGSSITIQLPDYFCNENFIGIALCAIISFDEDSDAHAEYFNLICNYSFEIKTRSQTKHVDDNCCLVNNVSMDLEHVILGFDPCRNVRLPDSDHLTAASFDFSLHYLNKRGYKVRRCGVCPLYAHSNQTKPTTSEIRKLHNDFHDMAETSGSIINLMKTNWNRVPIPHWEIGV